MVNNNLFSSFEKKDNEPQEVLSDNSDSNVLPSEAIASSNSPFESLTDEQKESIKETTESYGLEQKDIISEFNKAYVDKTLKFWNNDLPKKFKMAKAMMNSVLIEKAKLKKFTVIAIGKSIFLSKDKNTAISTMIGLVQYEVENETTGNTIIKEEIKEIKNFDKVGDTKNYQCLIKCMPFFTYETLLIKDKKHEFKLSEYTDFEMGTPPSEQLSNLSDEQLYEKINIKTYEDIKDAGMTKLKDDGFADSTDLKAVKVFLPKPATYSAPKQFPDLEGLSTNNAIDFEGNPVTLYFTSFFPEMKLNFSNLAKDERITGIAIGTIKENDLGKYVMSVYNFIPFTVGEE